MPSGAEFERTLRARDCYDFKRGLYLFTTLKNSWHVKDPLDFSGGTFSLSSTPHYKSHLPVMCGRGMRAAIYFDLSDDFHSAPISAKAIIKLISLSTQWTGVGFPWVFFL